MAKVMIMGEFLKLSDNIINKENLEKYIEFCLEKDVKNKTKENYLGINYNASKKLIKNNKKHLIGLYVEKIQ